jgi:MoxR-like ATPase
MADLSSDTALADACEKVESVRAQDPGLTELTRVDTAFIAWVKATPVEGRTDRAFQVRLWNDNPICGVGRGDINVNELLADEGFVSWWVEETAKPLSDDPQERIEHLSSVLRGVADECRGRDMRIPRLKILRAMAALYPTEFVSICVNRRLRRLLKAMGVTVRSKDQIAKHAALRKRLDEVLGSVDRDDIEGQARRITLPWYVYTTYVMGQDEDETEMLSEETGEAKLIPLPPERRRRGLQAFSGYFKSLVAIAESTRDGCEREDFHEHLRAVIPSLKKDSSLRTVTARLMGDWNLIAARGNRIELTDRGEAFLESGDPEEFADWLLTRILGFDFVLKYLSINGSQNKRSLMIRMKSQNPGWTSDFAPNAMLSWFEHLGLISGRRDGVLNLTPAGETWAQKIDWEPAALELLAGIGETDSDVRQFSGVRDGLLQPDVSKFDLDGIIRYVAEYGSFESARIHALHAGCWARDKRHFCVLTGLSGAGKTLLARAYGRAISEDKEAGESHLLTVPVQPGWYDPSPLLGYMNPIDDESYVRTEFLDLLLAAAEDSTQPYVVVLDEMNLSHPEQYMAPLLSAMETDEPIRLHANADHVDDVPPSVEYPNNLVIIGTVNMDETTHGLSDKVLDRAFVQEFWDVDLEVFPNWDNYGLPSDCTQAVASVLGGLLDALRPVRLHFGWRVVDDALGYLRILHQSGILDTTAGLDAVVCAKVLPKIRGDDTQQLQTQLEMAIQVLKEHELVQSATKLSEMLADLRSTGSVRFWR